MGKVKSWINAFRLRTLPLAVSSIIVGSAMASFDGRDNNKVFILALITAVLIQILSNLANDYGDFVKGTDNQNRVGPTRMMQSGAISREEMKTGMMVITGLAIFTGLWLVYEGTYALPLSRMLLFILFGALALIAAVAYTVGKRPYGYLGLGDLFVFIFFGLLGVIGTYFLQANQLQTEVWLLGITLGCFSTGVLNLNNMRDMDNDIASGKDTLASRLGYEKARYYHLLIMIVGWGCALIYTFVNYSSWIQLIFVPVIILFIRDLNCIFSLEKEKLDPYLKRLGISTFLFSVLFGVGLILS
ncbi:1,4-dihydroxy-2-naphthoate polyprenyltransferase [Puteibacter caeruleilacunae]|nr:1,4-dihydroxy-2-naphthoate polyprenyltransferase [Puteibacter caeruleilacunae]